MPNVEVEEPINRRTRKRLENRRAILASAAEVMNEKGIDAATMAEISDRADVALGSLYNHFESKQDLAIAVVDAEIAELAEYIDTRTAEFADPAMVFAFGNRTVMQHATRNDRWRQLLDRPNVVADRFHRGFGPYATRDLQRAVDAGRLECPDIDLAWRLTTWAIIGFSTAVCGGDVDAAALPDALASILGIAGMDDGEARRLVADLPAESARN